MFVYIITLLLLHKTSCTRSQQGSSSTFLIHFRATVTWTVVYGRFVFCPLSVWLVVFCFIYCGPTEEQRQRVLSNTFLGYNTLRLSHNPSQTFVHRPSFCNKLFRRRCFAAVQSQGWIVLACFLSRRICTTSPTTWCASCSPPSPTLKSSTPSLTSTRKD